MSEEYVREMFGKALDALSHGQFYLAMNCFDQARELAADPLYLSHRALCMARLRRSFDDALSLCRQALDRDPANTVHYLNMGKICLAAGLKQQAIKYFRDGLRHGQSDEIAAEIEKLGNRKAPVFKFLDRRHPLNKYGGMVLSLMGIR